MIKSILGGGLVAVDHIFLHDKSDPTESAYQYLGSAGGGTVSNALCLMSLLGYKTNIFGVVGNDLGEHIVKEEFRRFKVGTDNLSQRGGQKDLRYTRQYAHIISNITGKHKFTKICPNCASSFENEYQISKNDLKKTTADLAQKSDLLLLDRANTATLELAYNAERNSKKIAYDLSFISFGNTDILDEILKRSHLVKVNHRTFLRLMSASDDSAIIRWREKYPNVDFLLVTNGEKGSYGYANINGIKEVFHRKAIVCDHVRDCGGAGDIYLGLTATKLLLNEKIDCTKNFEEVIDQAQALASLSCTLYGARALQRTFLTQQLSLDEILDCANEIIRKGKSENLFSPSIGLPKPTTEPYRFSRAGECRICGAMLKRKKEKEQEKSVKYTSKDLESLTRLPWTMCSSFQLGRNYRVSASSIVAAQNTFFVGSGGSFTASTFGEVLYLHSLGKIAKAITPYEFEGLSNINNDTSVWFISHGGGNTDILGAALHAKELGLSKCAVLTGNKNSKLTDIAKEMGWKTFFIQSEERHFVSIIGLVSQVSALCGLLIPEEEIVSVDNFFTDNNLTMRLNAASREGLLIANEIASGLDNLENIHIVSFARGWGLPALVDLESKIVEGGICTIEISELKNFTHGRYINLYGRNNRRVVMIKTPKDIELIDYLQKRFSNRIKNWTLQTEEPGVNGSLELLIKVLFLAWHLGKIANRNILRPKFPEEARGLYSWEPSYRKGIWK